MPNLTAHEAALVDTIALWLTAHARHNERFIVSQIHDEITINSEDKEAYDTDRARLEREAHDICKSTIANCGHINGLPYIIVEYAEWHNSKKSRL